MAGLGPGGTFGVDVVAGGIRFLVRGGGWYGGGWPVVVVGLCGWRARWLPFPSLVLFVHGGLWPAGVGWWAVVVVGVVFVVVVVGPPVVVALVVVGLVLRVWPLDPSWVFRSPLWGGGSGIVRSPWGCTMWRAGWAAALGAAQPCGVSLTTRGIAPASLRYDRLTLVA